MIRKIVALLCMTVMSSFCFAHGNEQHLMGTVIKVSEESVTVETNTKGVPNDLLAVVLVEGEAARLEVRSMRLHRSFRDTDLNRVGHKLSVFHRHGVDDDSVPDMQVAWRCRCAVLY
jgi:hypothetical protein